MELSFRLNILFALLFTLSCSDSDVLIRLHEGLAKGVKSKTSGCLDNSYCKEDAVCLDGKCVHAKKFLCKPGEKPLLQLSKQSIVFKNVHINETAQEKLVLTNVGSCSLLIQKIGFLTQKSSTFACDRCDNFDKSMAIAPTQSLEISLTFSPESPGSFKEELQILSNDFSFDAQGLFKVGVSNKFSGTSKLVLEPRSTNFGYVPNGSRKKQQNVRLVNYGTKLGTVLVERITLDGDENFKLEGKLPSKLKPLKLQAYTNKDKPLYLDIPVVFEPSDHEEHFANVWVEGKDFSTGKRIRLSGKLKATSKGKPELSLDKQEILFQGINELALKVGSVEKRTVEIKNTGESELLIYDLEVLRNSGFSFFPTFFPPVQPGESTSLEVFFTPRSENFSNALEAFFVESSRLVLHSNDPEHPSTIINLQGWKQNNIDESLLIEMSFESSRSGTFGNDFRNVELEVVDARGNICRRPEYVQGLNGEQKKLDPCDAWSRAGTNGTASWVTPGLFEKPKRIALYDMPKGLDTDVIFTVNVQYAEDCSFMPSGLLANVLNISTDVLGAVLAGRGVGLKGATTDKISKAFSENCFDRSATTVTLKLLINGVELATPQVTLYRKGEHVDVLKLRYHNNHFEVL